MINIEVGAISAFSTSAFLISAFSFTPELQPGDQKHDKSMGTVLTVCLTTQKLSRKATFSPAKKTVKTVPRLDLASQTPG
jgi:hypothetical protein